LAFEALASLVFCNYCRDDVPEIKEWVERTYQGIKIGPSNSFFNPLVAHHSFDEIESLSVEQLAEIYPSYIHEIPYVQQYEVELLKGLQILRDSDFMELWHNELLPILTSQCNEASSSFSDEMIESVLSDISRVHRKKLDEDIYIYFTYFTHPASFNIAPNSYITNSGTDNPIGNFLPLLAHELCHGFSNKEAKMAYRNACEKDKYLHQADWFFDEFCAHPGNEEQFVQAIEHAIAVKNGLQTYDGVMKHFSDYYKCSVPIAIILSSELNKLKEIPADMNEWICRSFADGTIKAGEIEAKVNSIIPGYTDSFMGKWNEEEQKNPERFLSYKPI